MEVEDDQIGKRETGLCCINSFAALVLEKGFEIAPTLVETTTLVQLSLVGTYMSVSFTSTCIVTSYTDLPSYCILAYFPYNIQMAIILNGAFTYFLSRTIINFPSRFSHISSIQ